MVFVMLAAKVATRLLAAIHMNDRTHFWVFEFSLLVIEGGQIQQFDGKPAELEKVIDSIEAGLPSNTEVRPSEVLPASELERMEVADDDEFIWIMGREDAIALDANSKKRARVVAAEIAKVLNVGPATRTKQTALESSIFPGCFLILVGIFSLLILPAAIYGVDEGVRVGRVGAIKRLVGFLGPEGSIAVAVSAGALVVGWWMFRLINRPLKTVYLKKSV